MAYNTHSLISHTRKSSKRTYIRDGFFHGKPNYSILSNLCQQVGFKLR